MSVLTNEKALVGQDLEPVYQHFLALAAPPGSHGDPEGDPEGHAPDPNSVSGPDKSDESDAPEYRFKKKESVSTMAKSLLKHRLQTLTGQSMAQIQVRLGYDLIRDGNGMGVRDMRRLARLMLRQAHGQLGPPPARPNPRKRAPEAPALAPHEAPEPAVKRSRSSRRSVLPDSSLTPASTTPPKTTRSRRSLNTWATSESPACRLVPEPKTQPSPLIEDAPTEDDWGLENPTPAMIALKRKSLSRRGAKVTLDQFKAQKAVVVAQSRVQARPMRSNLPGASFEDENGQTRRCHITLIQGVSITLKYQSLVALMPEFRGAHLSMVHTPAEWGRGDVSNMIQCLRSTNQEAGLPCFLVLVGCAPVTVPIYLDALHRHTQHVQCVVIDRQDQNLEQGPNGMLRETCSYFLLAYFFPGCHDAQNSVPFPMVRKDMTTCFRTQSVEDLENTIVHALTVEGDCVLDLCCRGRELSLAAQKMGRFAVAIDEDEDKLERLKDKAKAIAVHHDKTFKGADVQILKM
ncbi:uncharacterized protein LOC131882210 [Tigriopus californicus]|uniref:uncharacterized protein LOC131882210 n=1 Tax=Tigriopus californicus TaxID=6832 RepID=UPI0027D9FF33|nr:uncharacterized protein LOC131882210 [Tigriopus californicus]